MQNQKKWKVKPDRFLAADWIESVIALVKKINPFAGVEKSSYARTSFAGHKNSFKYFPDQGSTESCRPDLQSVVIKNSRVIGMEKLTEFIDSVKGDFIRCKGYVNTGKEQKVAVQGTYCDYTIEPVEWFVGVTELVGIGWFREGENYVERFEDYCRQ